MMMNQAEYPDKITQRLRWIGRIWSLPILVYTLLLVAGYSWSWLTTGIADPYVVEESTFKEM